ncbi:DNRLRE domain-containing protein [Streptosporangium canum]|uniref:DNRLRE domain-containing protein n=1 Tax=Streptosporangium canum TaxID=324952 RepID=UPI001160BB88|nr:LamG-like jellyroll fold domain-containing protein [Streptosporangium canum]
MPAVAQGPTSSPAPSSAATTPPDAASDPVLKTAWDKAAASGKPVEVPSRFTETMKVWADPDGKNLRAQLHTRPVQLKNKAGAWEPVDTRIVTRDGTLQAARVKTPLTFGGRGTKHLVSAAGEQGTSGLGVTRVLPEPKISGSTITYPDAVAPGADLVVLALADGFVSQVVFRRRPDGPVTVRLPLKLPKGTSFGKGPEGLPQLKDAKGSAKAAPVVLTAMDAKVEASPEQGKSSPVTARVETSGKTSELVFTPDAAFLADPAVTYPVTIAAASEWFGGGVPDDAWVSKNSPSSNNAAAGWLRAGTTQTSADIARVYLKYDTDVPELEGATVVDADLYVWNYKSGGPNGQLCGNEIGSGIAASLITSAWTPTGLSWSNQPSNAGIMTGSGNKAGYNIDASGTWCASEAALVHRITGMARAWIEQGVANHGLVLRAVTESPAINWRQYYASEYSGDPYPGYRHPPTLMVEYTPAEKRYTMHASVEEDVVTSEVLARYSDPITSTPPRATALSWTETQAELRSSGEVIGRNPDTFFTPPSDWTPDETAAILDPDGEPEVPAEEAVLGHWSFDEGAGTTTTDSSEWSNTANLNDTARWTPGKSGTALTNATPAPPATAKSSAAPPSRLGAAAAAPTLSGFTVNPSQTVNGTIVTSSLTPTLKVTATDAAAAASTVEFRVLKYSDDSLVWSGSVANVPSGTQASITVPAAKLVDGTQYEWQVRATSAGGTSAWSAYQYFTADVPEAVVDQFQITPSLVVGTTTVSSSLTPTLLARVTDPLGGASTVAFEVARYSDDVTVWSGTATNVASGSQASVTVPTGKLLDGIRYEWRVKATTPNSTPAWSAYQYFTADVPEVVVDQFQVTPSRTVGTDAVSSSLTPTLLARVTDPLGGASTVAFEVARYSDDVTVWSGTATNVASGSQASVTVPTGKLLDGIRYEWRVKATTPNSTPAWSAYQYFKVDAAPLVDQFQVSPSKVVGDTVTTTSLTPTLLARVVDQLGGTATADFEVARYSDDVTVWSGTATNVTSGTQASIAVPAAKLVDGTRYEWRVRATAGGATSAWTSYQYFTVDVPEAVVDQFQVTPSETVGTATVTPSLTPALLASVTDPLGGAATVEFQVADWATDTVFWSTSVTGVASGAQASVTVPSGRLSDKVDYEFRVKATTSGSTPVWSNWQRFRIDLFDPATDPAVSQLQVIPSQNQGGVTTASSVTPELRALVSHPQGSASRVEFEVEHDPSAPQGQGSGQIWSTALDNVPSGTAAAVAVPVDKLADGWLVRWRLRSLVGGSSSTWSAWQQVKVAVPKPGVGQFQVTPSQVVDGKTVTTVTTPSLHAQVTYALGGTLRAEFEVEHDPAAPTGQGSGQIWTGGVDGVSAGTQGVVTLPGGKLADGWQVRWRVRSLVGTLASPWSAWQQLTVDLPGSAPSVQDLQITPAAQVEGETVTSTLTPHLRATVLDPRGEPVRAAFEVEHDPAAPTGQGSGQIWTGGVDNVAPGSQAALAVPDGKLSDGWVVRWRARATSATAASDWSSWQKATVEIPKPGVGLLQVTPSQEVDGKTVTSILTPSLHARVTYAPGGALRAEFEVEHDPAAPEGQGNGQIWATEVNQVPAGTQAAVAVPAGELTDGWVVRWRARSIAGTLTSPWSAWQQLTVKRPASAPEVNDPQVTPAQTVGGKTLALSLTPELRATLTDPRGDALTAEFEVEHDPAAPENQGSGQIWAGSVHGIAVNSRAVLAVPSGKLTDGWQVRWRVRATSETAASDWSDWRLFTVDLPKPDVAGLQLTPARTVDGVTATESLTPTLSAIATHPQAAVSRVEFQVEHDPAAPENQGSGQIWTGGVDDIASGGPAALTIPAGKLTDGWLIRWRARAVAGGVSAGWSSWLTVKVDLILPGEEPLAEATTALVPSESSFTVGAWVRWADKDGDYTVIEQRGTHQAAFRLGNTVEDGLVFTFASADTREASTGGVLSQVEPPVNQWFHLAGAYDAATKRATLYLNGVAIESATLGFTTWRADGVTTLGTRLNGSLDDIWIYDKAITAEEAAVAAGVTASAARVKSSVKAAAAASATPTYHRIAPADCIKENSSFYFPPRFPVPVRNPKGWNPGPHDWCVSQKPKFTVEVTDPRTLRSRVTDEASMVLMTIGRVFNDSRTAEIEVINLQLDDTVQGSVFDGQVFALGLDVQGSPASSCRQVVDSSHLSVYAGNESYWNNRKVAFKIESPESGWTPADTSQWLSECTIQLKLTVRDLPLMYKGAMAKGVVRCDSARENQLFPRGCIFDHKMRAVELHENTFPDAYAHIYKAYKTPNLTTPETTTTNPRLWPKHVPFGTGKEFPGFSTDTPLTRLNKKDSDPNVIKNRASRNYYRSFRICAIDYKSSWKGGAAPWDTSLKECDEYPFQSTYQGSWVSWQANKPADKGAPYKPGVAVSVSLIPKQQNTNWGATYHLAGLGRFYMNDRILYKENFILHLYNAAGNLVNPGP